MRKQEFCLGENKGADQLRSSCADLRIVQFLFFLNPKFQASSLLLCLYGSVCVGPCRKPLRPFSHDTAHFTAFLVLLVSEKKTKL